MDDVSKKKKSETKLTATVLRRKKIKNQNAQKVKRKLWDNKKQLAHFRNRFLCLGTGQTSLLPSQLRESVPKICKFFVVAD